MNRERPEHDNDGSCSSHDVDRRRAGRAIEDRRYRELQPAGEALGAAIFALAYRTLGREEDARDVTQETFLRASARLPASRATRSFRPGSIGSR